MFRPTDKNRQRLAAEKGLHPPSWGGRLSVALVYPNTYHHGMSNLGVQVVYAMLNNFQDTRCERFFLPDPEDLAEYKRTGSVLLSLETQRRLADFDLIAFSISFENDMLNLPILFELCHLPLWSKDRDAHFPLVLCGGVCAFLNPEPMAEIMDLFVIGEAEAVLPELVDSLLSSSLADRHDLLKQLSKLPGLYAPRFYEVDYNDHGFPRYSAKDGAPPRVPRQWLDKLDKGQAMTVVRTPNTEFSEMTLIEVSRGCPRACRFCAAGFIYRPFREHTGAHLQNVVSSMDLSGKVGLIAAALSDHAALADLGQRIQAHGGEVSVSSVRIDSISPEQVAMLAGSGHKTLALAPEAGSQRMRDVVNKGVNESQILTAVEMITAGGVPNLKLYFMIGLPGESLEDIEAIVLLADRIRTVWERISRQRGHLGTVVLSVNPFVPKPWTPLQWAAMEPRSLLEKKYRLLKKGIRPLPNVELHTESLRGSELQGLLARGDRRVAKLLPMLTTGLNLKAACRETGLSLGFYLYRERQEGEPFPWEIIDQGVLRRHLRDEYLAALKAQVGQVCAAGCQRCGIGC